MPIFRHEAVRPMAPSRASVVLAMFLAVSLSGCLADDTAPAVEPASGPVVITDPGNYTYVDDATLDNGGHIHDYWNGQKRIEVLNGEQPTAGYFLAQRSMLTLQPESGLTIPPGTGMVEITLEVLDNVHPSRAKPELWIKTQNDSVERYVAEIVNGETITFETTEAQADLPHQVLSAWELHVYGNFTDDTLVGETWLQWRVSYVADAIKSDRPPVVYPAHPDHWGDQSQLPLMETTHRFGLASAPIGLCFGGRCDIDPHDSLDGAIVPPDADHVLVTITETSTLPTRLGLYYHTAAHRDYQFPSPDTDDGTTRTYILSVDGQGDGPYSKQTLWDFRVFIDDPSGEGLAYSGEYTLSATVHRDPKAA